MPVSLQVLYPCGNDSSFDHDYYLQNHMKLVAEHFGQYLQSTQVARGIAGGPDKPAEYHAIATMVFADQAAMDAAMQASGPVMADVANFTDSPAQVLIGEVVYKSRPPLT